MKLRSVIVVLDLAMLIWLTIAVHMARQHEQLVATQVIPADFQMRCWPAPIGQPGKPKPPPLHPENSELT